MNEPVVEMTNITKKYGAKVAVSSLSLRIARGEVLGVLGPNGAGKTTTVECAIGLRTPDSARGTNVLVLDEPTNHLDLPAIEQLEEALETYDGALLLVTHDRRMLQNVRLDRSWLVDNGRVAEL